MMCRISGNEGVQKADSTRGDQCNCDGAGVCLEVEMDIPVGNRMQTDNPSGYYKFSLSSILIYCL